MVAPCHLGECSGFQDLASHPIRKIYKMWCFKNPGPTTTCSLSLRVEGVWGVLKITESYPVRQHSAKPSPYRIMGLGFRDFGGLRSQGLLNWFVCGHRHCKYTGCSALGPSDQQIGLKGRAFCFFLRIRFRV